MLFLHEHVLFTSASITWMLHFGLPGTRQQVNDIVLICDSITNMLNTILFPSFAKKTKECLRKTKYSSDNPCFFREWKAAGMSDEDMFAEFMHNLFGMTLQ